MKTAAVPTSCKAGGTSTFLILQAILDFGFQELMSDILIGLYFIAMAADVDRRNKEEVNP